MNKFTKNITLSLVSLLAIASTVNAEIILKKEDNNTKNSKELEKIVVVESSRLPSSLEMFPGTVRIIDEIKLKKLGASNNDLSVILGNYIPGFSPSAGQASSTNYDQTLRGRIPSVFIDGVPITTTLRNGRQDIRALHHSAIGSIEIVSGSSTLYGNGGAGGIVNYVTKNPSSDKISFSTEIGTKVSLTHFGDSFSPSATQTIEGDLGLVDFIGVAAAKYNKSFFDADGDRIAPNPNGQIGLSDTDIYNIYGKIGFEKGNHRLELSGLYYKQSQSTDYINGEGNVTAHKPVTAIIGENSPNEVDNGNENTMLNAVYTAENLPYNSNLRLQAYYLDYENIFAYINRYYPGGGQSYVTSKKYGSRLDLSTPLNIFGLSGGRVLYGIDYLNDTSKQPLKDGRTFVPEITQSNIAGFFQAELPLGDRFFVSGGFRYEDFSLEVDSFTALFSKAKVTGGDIDFTEFTYNIGSTFQLSDQVSFFAGYSQGASVAEIGRILRSAKEDIDISTFNLETSVTQSYEAGVRYEDGKWGADLTLFQNKSNLGASVTLDPGTSEFIVALSPEKVKGVELTIDYSPTQMLETGGSFTYMEGDRDSNNDGSYDTPLTGQTIPPSKLTGYVGYDFTESIYARTQLSYTGGRNEFPGSKKFGQGKVHSRLIIDAQCTLKNIGLGTIQFGVHNLFNEDYFTHTSEIAQISSSYSKGSGATGFLNYKISY